MYTDDELSKLSSEEKKKKRNSIQMEVIMLESDLRKAMASKGELEAEIRKINYDEQRLRIAMDEKKKEFEKVVREIEENEAEIKRLRKKLNLLA